MPSVSYSGNWDGTTVSQPYKATKENGRGTSGTTSNKIGSNDGLDDRRSSTENDEVWRGASLKEPILPLFGKLLSTEAGMDICG